PARSLPARRPPAARRRWVQPPLGQTSRPRLPALAPPAQEARARRARAGCRLRRRSPGGGKARDPRRLVVPPWAAPAAARMSALRAAAFPAVAAANEPGVAKADQRSAAAEAARRDSLKQTSASVQESPVAPRAVPTFPQWPRRARAACNRRRSARAPAAPVQAPRSLVVAATAGNLPASPARGSAGRGRAGGGQRGTAGGGAGRPGAGAGGGG